MNIAKKNSIIFRHYEGLSWSKNRDFLLDFAKGGAIFLVVLGHTFQGFVENFDEFYGFRFIYSFHMPLFAFLSGAAATFWVRKFDFSLPIGSVVASSVKRLRKSALSLLLPFFCWTVIGYYMISPQDPLLDYLLKVFKQPDYSLWFLPCIFWCTTYTVVLLAGIYLLKRKLETSPFHRFSKRLEDLPIQALLMLTVWKIFSPRLPSAAGLAFANNFHGGLFFFFVLGLVFFDGFSKLNSFFFRALPYLLFFGFVQFWHRTSPHNLIDGAPNFLVDSWIAKFYPFVMAISGALAFIDISRVVASFNLKMINFPVCYWGSISLAIYAAHFYFINYKPPVIAAVLLSTMLYWVAGLIPLVRKSLFGK